MGKKAKEHRKKVAKRNEKVKQHRALMEKEYQKMVAIKTEELRAKFNQVVEEGVKEKQSQVEDAEILGETTETV
jgi:hypothetical protein